MIRALLLLCVIIVLSNDIHGQKNFIPGYILRAGNDTLKGEIDYRNWEYNPSKILFRSFAGTTEQTYTPTEIEGFGIDGIDRYIRAIVLMDMNLIAINDLSSNPTDATRTDTVFLRILVNGNRLNLYEFVDFKPHYFIQSGQGTVEELTYKVSVDGSGKLVSNNGFRTQLRRFVTDSPASKEQLRDAGSLQYELKDLVKFVTSLNDPATVFVPQDLKKSKNEKQLFAGGGLVTGKLGFKGRSEELSNLQFSRTVSFLVRGGIDFYATRNMQKLFFRAELSVSGFSGEGKGSSGSTGSAPLLDNEYSMQQLNITPAVSANYSIIQAGKMRIYTGAGLGFNFSSYPKHIYTSTNRISGLVSKREDFPELQKSWITVFARIGILFGKNIELGLSRQMAGSFINYSYIAETTRPVSLHFFYRFR